MATRATPVAAGILRSPPIKAYTAFSAAFSPVTSNSFNAAVNMPIAVAAIMAPLPKGLEARLIAEEIT